MTTLHAILYPELRALPPGERAIALREARRTPLDVVELLGIAGGLVLATALARHGAEGLDVALALPLIAAFVGPFFLRRARRGLRCVLERRAFP